MTEILGNIDNFIGGYGRVDPEDVTSEEDAATAAQKAFYRDAEMRAKIARVFTRGEGPAVLKWLQEITIKRSVQPYELIASMTADQRAAHTSFREGENEVVRNIILAIQEHEQGESHETQGQVP